jgi:hypothetical protein
MAPVKMKTIIKTVCSIMHLRITSPVLLFAAVLYLVILPLRANARADSSSAQPPVVSAPQEEKTNPIQDNSFLIEEAYNQEFGVVQHINTFSRNFNSHSWQYTFTQEWPVPGIRHQLSYTLSAVRETSHTGGAGLGDTELNYRYQLIGSGDTKVAFAPRASLLIPSGNYRDGHGVGGYGAQINLPLSVVLSEHLVTHWNAGTTMVPHARNEFGDRAATYGYNLGQSFVWLIHPRFNALVETSWVGSENVVGRGRTQRVHDLLISPGVRWAYNFKSGLQIVPGIAVPVGVGPSAGEKSLFLYLSFEHPFRSLKRS